MKVDKQDDSVSEKQEKVDLLYNLYQKHIINDVEYSSYFEMFPELKPYKK